MHPPILPIGTGSIAHGCLIGGGERLTDGETRSSFALLELSPPPTL